MSPLTFVYKAQFFFIFMSNIIYHLNFTLTNCCEVANIYFMSDFLYLF